ncbi:MAG: low-complexity tail membrane protein [Spirulina sp. SIO3F2]|nr:low-complexity tail membrane protein [Spirulina sp. SIO3F2]
MNPFRQEPYLWLHVAGLAVLPLWALGVWLGVAAGEPWLPYGVEETLLVLLGIAPWLWVQWRRPFNPFAILVVSLPPAVLTTEQRQWLQLLKRPQNRIVAVLAVLPMVWLLGQCYQLAPLASSVTPIPNHGLGLLVAAIAFSGANLFIQVALSMVGLLLLTSEAQLAAAAPYDPKQIDSDFFRFGFKQRQILPPVVRQPSSAPQPETTDTDAVMDANDETSELVADESSFKSTDVNLGVGVTNEQNADNKGEEVDSEISKSALGNIKPVQSEHESSSEIVDIQTTTEVEMIDRSNSPDSDVETMTDVSQPTVEGVVGEFDTNESKPEIEPTQLEAEIDENKTG